MKDLLEVENQGRQAFLDDVVANPFKGTYLEEAWERGWWNECIEAIEIIE